MSLSFDTVVADDGALLTQKRKLKANIKYLMQE